VGPGPAGVVVQCRAVSQQVRPLPVCLSVRPLTLGSQSRSGIDDDVAVTYLLIDWEGGGRVLLFVAWRRANRVGSYLGEGTRAANNASSHTTDGSHALSNALSLSLSLSLQHSSRPPTPLTLRSRTTKSRGKDVLFSLVSYFTPPAPHSSAHPRILQGTRVPPPFLPKKLKKI
jgi:hypothetical protein